MQGVDGPIDRGFFPGIGGELLSGVTAYRVNILKIGQNKDFRIVAVGNEFFYGRIIEPLVAEELVTGLQTTVVSSIGILKTAAEPGLADADCGVGSGFPQFMDHRCHRRQDLFLQPVMDLILSG